MNKTFVLNKINAVRRSLWKRESVSFAKKCVKDLKTDQTELSQDEIREIRVFYEKCGFPGVDLSYHRLYYAVTGRRDKRFLPDWFLSCYLNKELNDQRLTTAWTDKSNLERFLPGARVPHTVIRNVNGSAFNDAFDPMSEADADRVLSGLDRVIVKPSIDSGGGKDVQAFTNPTRYEEICREYGKNFVVQEVLKQHESTAVFNESSVNTIRIISLFWKGEVYICGVTLRTGIKGAITDNISHGQGISFGLHEDGRIADVCYSNEGLAFSTSEYFHVNKEHRIACVPEAIAFVKRQHPLLPYFKLIAWDIAVLENGDLCLIEYNNKAIGITLFQYNAGPLFGELTEEVLSFYGKRK